jgi:acyl carrier protein
MDRTIIVDKLKEIISLTLKKRGDCTTVNEQSDLVEDLGISSIEAIQIMVRAENEFKIQFDNNQFNIESVRTISRLADYISASYQDDCGTNQK